MSSPNYNEQWKNIIFIMASTLIKYIMYLSKKNLVWYSIGCSLEESLPQRPLLTEIKDIFRTCLPLLGLNYASFGKLLRILERLYNQLLLFSEEQLLFQMISGILWIVLNEYIANIVDDKQFRSLVKYYWSQVILV